MNKTFHLILLTLMFGLAISCSEDFSPINNSDTEDIGIETSVETTFEDIDDLLSNLSFISDGGFNSRVEGLNDRFCDETEVKLMNKVKSNIDTLIVNFGSTGCIDPKGNVRKGKIIMYFLGDKKLGHTTTFLEFYFNDKKIEGTRVIELIKLVPPTFYIQLQGGKITWSDGSFATREASHTRVWQPDLVQPSNSLFYIKKGGTASGKNRNGKEYSMEIINDLVFKRLCMEPPTRIFMPVNGIKVISATALDGSTKVMSIDYGDGQCDKKVIITIDGKSKEVILEKD